MFVIYHSQRKLDLQIVTAGLLEVFPGKDATQRKYSRDGPHHFSSLRQNTW